MRGRIGGVFMNPNGLIIGNARTSKSLPFSSFGSSARGRGRGQVPNFVAGNTNENDDVDVDAGVGHGRGHPSPPSNSFRHSFVAPNPALGLGRGRGGPVPGYETKNPIFLKKDNDHDVDHDNDGDAVESFSPAKFVESVPRQPIGAVNLPENILTTLGGTGRGKPEKKIENNSKEENRHLRPRRVAADTGANNAGVETVTEGRGGKRGGRPKLSPEEAVKRAVGVLSRGDEGRKGQREFGGGGRKKKVGGWRDGEDDDDMAEDSEEEDRLLGVGDDANGEKLANKLGTSKMAELSEALDEMLEESVPEPGDDEFLEAYDTNLKIELEPEYLMGDFETNPDINENPPIPLCEALEKMKPFLMAYEGIEDQEEWEKIIEDTMERVPLMKEIVDHYCGPDRVTAKQQHEELERVANTLPVSAPNSVKNFTDCAVLSLQSNPGWGFHRKCQFMDKLVDEFSKAYK